MDTSCRNRSDLAPTKTEMYIWILSMHELCPFNTLLNLRPWGFLLIFLLFFLIVLFFTFLVLVLVLVIRLFFFKTFLKLVKVVFAR